MVETLKKLPLHKVTSKSLVIVKFSNSGMYLWILDIEFLAFYLLHSDWKLGQPYFPFFNLLCRAVFIMCKMTNIEIQLLYICILIAHGK